MEPKTASTYALPASAVWFSKNFTLNQDALVC
jgi:hypothetical protein